MRHEHLIEFLIKKVGAILYGARGPHRQISDELAVKTILALIASPRTQVALEQANDKVQAFVMRAVNRVLLSNSKTPRVLVNELQEIISDYTSLEATDRTGSVWPKKWSARYPSGPR
jgi:hypothetical protein